MSDATILRANERYKAIASVALQLGTALLAAAFVKFYVDGRFSLEATGWLVIAAVLIWVGWMTLGLLEPERPDDADPPLVD